LLMHIARRQSVGKFGAGFEELAEFVAVEGVMAELAAFEN